MTPKLYMAPLSPPVRAVLLTAKALGLTLERINVDLATGEHVSPDFQKLNSQHTIPTLDDDGVIIWDSHAIAAYLVAKYAKDDALYPTDIVKRAKIDQRLHFDTGVVFPNIRNTCKPIFKYGRKPCVTEETKDALEEAYNFLESFLEEDSWIAGDSMTIADLCLVASVTSADVLVPIKGAKHPKLCAWIKNIQALPYYRDANGVGLQSFRKLFN